MYNYQSYNPYQDPFKFPSINQYQSSITFLPKQDYKQSRNQLHVGFDPNDLGLAPIKKQQRAKSPIQKFIDEFPAHYLDLLPLPPFLKQEKEPNYIVLEKQIERPHKTSSLKLPLLKLNQEVPSIQQFSSKSNQLISPQISIQPSSKSKPSSKQVIQQMKSQQSINLKKVTSNKNIDKKAKKEAKPFIPSELLKRFIRKVNQLKIMLSFHQLIVETLNYNVNQVRKQQWDQFKENQQRATIQLSDWLDISLEKFLLELTNYNLRLNLKVGEDSSNSQKKKKIQSLFDLMIKGIDGTHVEDYFTKQLALLLNKLTQSYSFAPQQYYFLFEVMRFRPTINGSIGEMTQNQQRMVLLLFLFVRQIIFSQILITWQFHPVQEDNNEQLGIIQTNSVILSSILHEIIIKWVEKNVLKKRGLDLDLLKVQFAYISTPLSLDLKKMEKQGRKFAENELIDGLMSSTGVQKYLYKSNGEYEEYVQKIETDMIRIVDKILEQINKEYQLEQKQKDRIVKLMSIYFSKSLST